MHFLGIWKDQKLKIFPSVPTRVAPQVDTELRNFSGFLKSPWFQPWLLLSLQSSFRVDWQIRIVKRVEKGILLIGFQVTT